MTDRDAFGRPIAGSGPTVQPLGSPGRGLGPSGSGRGGPPRRQRSGLRRILCWFVVFDLIAIVVIAVLVFGGGDEEAIVIPPPPSEVSRLADEQDASDGTSASDEEEPAAPDAEPAAPAGFNAASLLRPANLQRAIERARALGQGKPMMVRVEATRIDLQLARPDGAMVLVQVAPDSPPRVVTTVAGAARGRPTMPWSAITLAAPQRLARSSGSTKAAGPSSTDYVVFLEQTREWVLYRKDGRGYIAGATGRGGTRIPGT